MTKGEEEEIIDLTEMVEEPSISGEKENRGVAAKAEDQAGGGERPSEGAWPSRPEVESPLPIAVTPEEKPAPETEPKAPTDGPRALESPKPVCADSESAAQALQEALTAKAEKWLSDEGQQILERVAREMFPVIATEVLRQEIEKLKAEAEEKA